MRTTPLQIALRGARNYRQRWTENTAAAMSIHNHVDVRRVRAELARLTHGGTQSATVSSAVSFGSAQSEGNLDPAGCPD